MIAIQQIRAARAMLNWSQQKLASAVGISARSLHSIETGLTTPRLETIKGIKRALEKANIEFGDGCTVSLRQEIFDMEKCEGESALEFIVHDFIAAYRQGTTELLLHSTDERQWIEKTAPTTAEEYFKTMTKHGAKERCLITHGDTNIMGLPSSYRWLPRAYFAKVCYAVYGSTLALIVWHPVMRIALIRNAAIADSYRCHFEFIWEHAEIPPFAERAQLYPCLDKPQLWLSDTELTQLYEGDEPDFDADEAPLVMARK